MTFEPDKSKRRKMSYNHVCQILLVAMAVAASVALMGCDSFLSRTPSNAISSAEFFQNEDQVEQAVLGVYAKLQDMYRDQWRFTEQRSDNTTTMWNDENRGPHPTWIIEEWTMTPSNIELEPYWGDIYEGIQRANTVINNIDNVQFSDQRLKDKLSGEARFLRAFFYFNQVRLFGEVPLVLEQVQTPDGAFSTLEGKASVEELYEQILNDANEAAELLPTENQGRATEGAARALLAEIHLTRQNYERAVSELERVMEIGYSLLPNYEDLFDPANKGHSEDIFSVQYAELESNIGLGANFIYLFAPHNSGTEITGDNASNPTGLNLPTRGMLDAYEPGDERKDASIGLYIDPENTQHGIAIGDTIPYVKKYDSPHSVRGVTNDNWPVYRYADILLMMAEALNEIGQTGEAYAYIDPVRTRAGLDGLTQGLSQSQFRDSVYHEQRLELAFENDRWFNLLRTDRALEAMAVHANVHRGIQTHWQEPAYDIQEYKLTYPIPQRELTLNPDLEQNPGW